MYRQPQASPRMPMTTETDSTVSEALAHAWTKLKEAREALARTDGDRQAECARLAIDAAATVLTDPAAVAREVVAAHCFLRDALALDGRSNTCGIEHIDTIDEISTLSPESQKWLQDYLLPTPVVADAGFKSGMRRAIALRKGKRGAAVHARETQNELIGGEDR
jgi:hypothetical protein